VTWSSNQPDVRFAPEGAGHEMGIVYGCGVRGIADGRTDVCRYNGGTEAIPTARGATPGRREYRFRPPGLRRILRGRLRIQVKLVPI
jgi:hypothetical protein